MHREFNLRLLLGDTAGCVTALMDAIRIAKLQDPDAAYSVAEFQLLGFHLYA